MAEISKQIKEAIKGAILLEINGRKFFNLNQARPRR